MQTVSAKWNAPYVLQPAKKLKQTPPQGSNPSTDLLQPKKPFFKRNVPIGSMYGICTFGWYNPFTYIWRIFMVNVRKYTIPWILCKLRCVFKMRVKIHCYFCSHKMAASSLTSIFKLTNPTQLIQLLGPPISKLQCFCHQHVYTPPEVST